MSQLLHLLLHQGEFSKHCVLSLATLLGIEQTTLLMKACQDLYNEDAVLYVAPKKWNDHHEVRKIVRALVTMGPRWQTWIRTSNVEEMMFSNDYFSYRGIGDNCIYKCISEAKGVSDEWIHMIVSSGKFPRLTSINLFRCSNITNAGVIEIARRCPQLTSLNLSHCDNITDVSVIGISIGCQQLKSINLSGCRNITDTSVIEITKGCPQLTSINLSHKWNEAPFNITSASVSVIAKRCPKLTSIVLSFIDLGESGIELARGCPQLTSIAFDDCRITDALLIEFALRCPHLTAVHFNCCCPDGVTDKGVIALAQSRSGPNLIEIDLTDNYEITNASVIEIARRCPQLKYIHLDECRNIMNVVTCKKALRQGCPHVTIEGLYWDVDYINTINNLQLQF